MNSTRVFPLFLRLEGRLAIVVGGGAVGAQKVRSLLDAGARVRVLDPSPGSEVEALAHDGAIELRREPFSDAALDEAWLVIAATDDPAVNAAVARAAEGRRMFCTSVDDPPNCSAFFGAIVRRPPLTVAISSSGDAPALSRLMREMIEHLLPEGEWVERARVLREKWRSEGTPMGARFGELVAAFASSRVSAG